MMKEYSRRKTVHDNESMIDSNNEYTDSNLNRSNSRLTSRLKQSKVIFNRENYINSNTEKRKKKSMFK